MYMYIYIDIDIDIDILYMFKIGKIKLKYSCNSEFHAEAIIRHIISFLSKNKQKNIFVRFRIKIKLKTHDVYIIKLGFTVSSLHVLIRTCLNVCIY